MVAGLVPVPRPALALSPPSSSGVSVEATVCGLIEAAARHEALPVGFLTRLIWQESSFRPSVTSPAGAQGIAQFMPTTAGERGLRDPFDPEEAIPKAAGLLAELLHRFGTLGLAAAYNAGPARVADWLSGTRSLPAETRAYVESVTRRSVESWRSPDRAPSPDAGTSCREEVARIRTEAPSRASRPTLLAPWGVQLAGSSSKAAALAAYASRRAALARVLSDVPPLVIGGRARGRGFRAFYQVRFPAPSRPAALALCDRILKIGGACSVSRS